MSTDDTERAGVGYVQYRVPVVLGWAFREQPTSDYGVDAHVEVKVSGKATGRLVGLQIKTGTETGYFREPVEGGWIYRPIERHVKYWLGHSLPIYVIFVHIESESVFWQRVSSDTLTRSKTGGWKLFIPERQTLDTASQDWNAAAEGTEQEAILLFQQNLAVLPPSVQVLSRKLHEEESTRAALLSHFLASGRAAPDVALLGLSEGSSWLDDHDGAAARIVGEYAIEHGYGKLAAHFIEMAARKEGQSQAVELLTVAGYQVLPDDHEQARRLFQSAVEATGDTSENALLALLGLAALDAPRGLVGPVPIEPALTDRLLAAQETIGILQFKASQAALAADDDEAIALWLRALELAPDRSVFNVRLAHCYGRRAMSGRFATADLREARIHARVALEQRHRWDGPSAEALEPLIRSLVLLGEFEEVLDRCMPPPLGTARPSESTRPFVLLAAAHAASFLGRGNLLPGILQLITDPSAAKFAEAEFGDRGSLSTEDLRDLWLEALDLTGLEDAPRLVAICMRLADLGVDRSDSLENAVARNDLPDSSIDLVRALAHARADINSGLPKLRLLASRDPSAVECLVSVLVDSGRVGEAADECRRAATRFGTATFSVLRAEVLYGSEDLLDEAATAAADALSDGTVGGVQRQRMWTILISQSHARGDWPAMERYCLLSLEFSRRHGAALNQRIAWALVRAQLAQRHVEDAAISVRTYRPIVSTLEEAKLWCDSMILEPLNRNLASEALTLALRFAEDPQLSSVLLTRIITYGTGSPPNGAVTSPPDLDLKDIKEQAFQAIEQHVNQHGDAGGIFLLRRSPEELVDMIASDLQRNHQPLREIFRQVWVGSMPLGLLSDVTSRPYSLLVASQAVGVSVAGSLVEAEYDAEVAACEAAIDSKIVADVSALLLSGRIGQFDRVRALFPAVVLPEKGHEDVLKSLVSAMSLGESSGFMWWDSETQSPCWSEASVADIIATQARLRELSRMLRMVDRVTVDTLSLLARLPDASVVWASSIEYAAQEGLALWSDDVAMRRLARALGVPSFGTLALLDFLSERASGLNESGVSKESLELFERERAALIAAQVSHKVVDVAATVDILLEQARVDDWSSAAVAAQLARPSWWLWRDSAIDDLWHLLRQAEAAGSSEILDWRASGMAGAAAAFSDDPAHACVVLAVLALLPVGQAPVAEQLSSALSAARRIAADWGISDPLEQVPQAEGLLRFMGMLSDGDVDVEELVRLHGQP